MSCSSYNSLITAAVASLGKNLSSLKKSTGINFEIESINLDFALIRIPFNAPDPLISPMIFGYFAFNFIRLGLILLNICFDFET